MSRAALCGPCMWGNHAEHDHDWGIRPGVIGGNFCDCGGDCAKKADAAVDWLIAATTDPPAQEVPC